MIAQAAAVPYREGPFGPEVLLISTRGKTGGWGIPKGGIKKGHTARQTARLETLEEAGVLGVLHAEPLGRFEYRKRGRLQEVKVFALKVNEQLARWAEEGERQRIWVPMAEAGPMVERKEVGRFLTKLRHELLAASLAVVRRAA